MNYTVAANRSKTAVIDPYIHNGVRFLIAITAFVLLQITVPVPKFESFSISGDFSLVSEPIIAKNLSAFECVSDFSLSPFMQKKQKEEALEKGRKLFRAKEPALFGAKNSDSILSELPANKASKSYLYAPAVIAYDLLDNFSVQYHISKDSIMDFAETELKPQVYKITAKSSVAAKAPVTPCWPVVGKITSPFGMRRHPITKTRAFHNGIDIRASTGTRIAAPADGEVIFAGWEGGYGKMVRLKTKGGVVLLFAHMSSIKCKKGDRLKRGHLVGKVGSTGRSTGPHLHFSVINKQNEYINPLTYLPKRK